ncbi:MAG TPA: hypothetical protein ENG03_00190 [Thioploca sp.]|nr:MAG: hypothetical protein B6247_31035 [Beggiatoa sp. 4572_84]RKZ47301.1 MAG: hypothetical protein DRR08_32520 [Gammaproteobacteria bacterium]HDN25521.1 hypothetical protein [Thioploca sp.]
MLIQLALLGGVAAYWLRHHQGQFRPNQVSTPADNVQPSRIKRFSPKQQFKEVKSALSGDEPQQQLIPILS